MSKLLDALESHFNNMTDKQRLEMNAHFDKVDENDNSPTIKEFLNDIDESFKFRKLHNLNEFYKPINTETDDN